MEIRHLISFLAVAEELHFTRAARKIHMAQSALSDQIQKLEQDVGVRLLDRTSRTVSLTPAGAELRDHARTILTEVDAARDAARTASRPRPGAIAVGYSMLASQSVLPCALERMYAASPGVRVTLREDKTGPHLDALGAGELDVALVFGRPTMPGLSARRLHGVRIVAVVGRRDVLARGSSVPFRTLAGRDCVMFDRAKSPAMYDAITGSASRAGFTLKVTETVDDPCAAVVMVTTRNLVGFTSSTESGLVRASPGLHRTRALQLTDPAPAIELYVAWRSDEENPLVQDFVRHAIASSNHG